MLEKGILDLETFKASSNPEDLFVLHRKSEIEALRANFNVTPLHLVATDGHTNYMRPTIDEMDDFTYNIYLKYHFATCERQDLIGMSNHSLDIFRKE